MKIYKESLEAMLAIVRNYTQQTTDMEIERRVYDIIADVRTNGDAALKAYSEKFDGVSIEDFKVPQEEIDAAYESLSDDLKAALLKAKANITEFHSREIEQGFVDMDTPGIIRGQKVIPLARVGLYVPGGTAAYPSTIIMTALPAKIAGVREIVMVTPPQKDGINPAVLGAAKLAGVDAVYQVGGAQGVAALAYGTETIPKVDKIVGPGNIYVATAKRQVFGQVDIDMIAGPSEILVLADGTTPPDWVAMDLFSQAEHDELAQSILLCPDAAYIDAVQASINRLLPTMPRAEIIAKSLTGRGALILTKDMDEACAISNRIAPEHLEVSSNDPHRWEPLLRHAGAIFLGAYTSESLGDYCAGPNHVLPTSGTARFSSPLGVYDFQKRSSLIEVSEAGAQVLGRIASVLARGEGLQGHARAAEMRLK